MRQKKYTDEDLIKAVRDSHSCSEVCRKLGIVDRGGNLNTIKKKIKLFSLDISHFTGQGWSKGLTVLECPKLSHKNIKDMLVDNYPTNSDNLKRRLIREGLKEYKCECCGNTEWNGKPIPLELHHINGKHVDNRLENLQLLCPNCHAQTDTYGFKNRTHTNDEQTLRIFKYKKTNQRVDVVKKTKILDKKSVCLYCGKEYIKKRSEQKYCSEECAKKSHMKSMGAITKKSLIQAFIDHKSFTKVGLFFGISDRAVIKWCKKFDMPTTRHELDIYIDNI